MAMVLAILLAGITSDSQACNVPAFRYALERWPADPYQLLVYYETSPPGKAYDLLQRSAVERGGIANYTLKGIDVTKPEGKALAEQRKIAVFPWVEAFYPSHSQVRTPVWSGPLTLDRARRILDSPKRSGLAQKLLSGEVAVWILIKSGNEVKDRRALQSLRACLERGSKTLKIPETGTDLNGNQVEVADFKTYPVHFDLMEIARDDPEEDLLVNALMRSEPDLGQYDDPLAFPVFGRGRALYALVGDGIQEKNIQEACQSLIAWCSCEVKALNPGTDLLISANWSRPCGGKMVKDPDLPLAGLSVFHRDPATTEAAVASRMIDRVKAEAAPRAPVAANGATGSVAAGTPAQVPGSRENPVVQNMLYLAGAVGLALLVLSVFVKVKIGK